jgi:hypothetical protein
MESFFADPNAHATLTGRARGLVILILARLNAASDHTEDLICAFHASDAYRALTIITRLQKSWSEAYLALLVLEQLSGHREMMARSALYQSHHRGGAALARAFQLVSHLLDEHNTVRQCSVPLI